MAEPCIECADDESTEGFLVCLDCLVALGDQLRFEDVVEMEPANRLPQSS